MPEIAETRKKQWPREEVAEKMEAYAEAYQQIPSQRQVAEELKVPRSTVQHWLKRKDSIDAEPEVVAFFESAVGMAFLHRLVLAAHFVITLLGPSGIRRVCLFLELTGLDQFVAASYGVQQQVSVAMEESVVAFDKEEKKRLATDMKTRQITVCEDETFHPEVCLVAIETVSNFILLEHYADNRKAETWTQAMEEATEGLDVEIVQSTSDEGKGLLCHVQEDLGVHHSPDVFHVQHELVKGSSGALASKKRQAEKTMAKAATQASRHQKKKEGNKFYRHATFYSCAEAIRHLGQAGYITERVISTLFQKPGEVHRVEKPREGYSPNAGFTIIVAGKKATTMDMNKDYRWRDSNDYNDT